jgi:hypothetical protein
MRNRLVLCTAVICSLMVGASLSALARSAKAPPLEVTYYFLPG